MKSNIHSTLIVLLFLFFSTKVISQDLGQTYIEAWKSFYPSKALAQGMHSSIFQYENFSDENITMWVEFNQQMLEKLSSPNSEYTANAHIDARLLKVQVQKEVDIWEKQRPHKSSVTLYTNLLAKAIPTVLEADYLNIPDRVQLICTRLNAIEKLCTSAETTLQESPKREAERGLSALNRLEIFLKDDLHKQFTPTQWEKGCTDFEKNHRLALKSVQSLILFISKNILPNAQEATPILGREEYARRLGLYTDSQLTPEELGEMVKEEIEITRDLIGEVSKEYLQEKYPNQPIPKKFEETIRLAFDDMEKDAPKNGAEYLSFWQDLSASAIAFIEEHDIATLPTYQTLRIMSAPESAGAAARIGWVASAPPFAPNPVTTLYLPSIPDTLPEQERIDFWSSFNKPFNRMIVIHELFPGHYMQIKISRETAHPIRLLFPYGPYIEGWATFTERVLLDEGWEKENKLTLLAHLRKRLENANRAYMSVQVHCNGWTEEQVMAFSTETSLLAPQFAKSLWGRLMRSPMQITSYFYGGKQFTQLFEAEKKRLGDKFVLQSFMDTILKAGAIPIDEFPTFFR